MLVSLLMTMMPMMPIQSQSRRASYSLCESVVQDASRGFLEPSRAPALSFRTWALLARDDPPPPIPPELDLKRVPSSSHHRMFLPACRQP
jgi:hypothetical protein